MALLSNVNDRDNTTRIAPQTTVPRRWLALVVVCAALALDMIGVGVINTATPSIKQAFELSESTLQWVVTSYALTFAGFLLLGGRLADVFGRRLIFLSGIAIFVVASLGAALAPTGAWLIVARALQGIGAAVSSPAALALIGELFPQGTERDRAFGIYSSVGASSFAFGLVLGGILTDIFGWRSIFLLSVILGLVVILGGRFVLPVDTGYVRQSLDLPGAVLVTAGLILAVYGVTQAHEYGWTNGLTLALLILAIALLGGFILRERLTAQPLLPLTLFQLPTVRTATLTGAVFFTAFNGLMFFGPLYLQGMLHYSAFTSGLAFVPMSLTVIIASNVAGRLLARTGQRLMLIGGQLLIAAGVTLWAFIPLHGSYLFNMLPGILIMSVGQGLAFTAMTAASLTEVPTAQQGVAGGLNVTAQQVGSGLGVALLVALSTARTASLGSDAVATLSGYHWGLAAGALAALAGAVLTFWLLPGKSELRP
ncbi:MFS transporter [Ktedonosporobacter rubrisoli]|uniref:MFS transporter n=1 Tax=Ktedonosporobacter rubrisoli TaxID=2509675 RepID=A0A4P6K1V0_KTERU|nr:MFS transporter [Ktedonosporobacter rubrisoli]QBD81813.1 MFS transporter [Ktedonosporobacter rubrisoli]